MRLEPGPHEYGKGPSYFPLRLARTPRRKLEDAASTSAHWWRGLDDDALRADARRLSGLDASVFLMSFAYVRRPRGRRDILQMTGRTDKISAAGIGGRLAALAAQGLF